MRKIISILILFIWLSGTGSAWTSPQNNDPPRKETAPAEASGINWEGWSDSVFEQHISAAQIAPTDAQSIFIQL